MSSAWSDPEGWGRLRGGEACPVCRAGTPDDVLTELEASWVTVGERAPMRGYACLVARRHVVEIHELGEPEAAAFMRDLRRLAAAVQGVTGAVKLNYEIHGNTIPHLHVHMYPRHRRDPFEGGPIDARLVQGAVYAPGELAAVRGRLLEALGGVATGLAPTSPATALWRRLDVPGHDACRLLVDPRAVRLEGTAVFLDESGPVRLDYEVTCDPSWRTREGRVHGWLGSRPARVTVERTEAGAWLLDGALVTGLEDCVDLDLAFTPATNALQLSRVALAEGQTAEFAVAWLDPATGAFTRLPQIYTRRSATTYWYESPTVGYADLLEIAPSGFARRYPGLWELEA